MLFLYSYLFYLIYITLNGIMSQMKFQEKAIVRSERVTLIDRPAELTEN